MAITYHAGRRIQGLSTEGIIPRVNTGVATSDQIVRYDFEETSGTTLNDKVGSIDGTASGGVDITNTGVFGVGNAWKFDGSNDKVAVTQTFGTVSAISCSVWIKRYGTADCPIAMDSNTSNFGTGIWFHDHNTLGLRLGHQSSGDDVNTGTHIPDDGNWHHVVFMAYSTGGEIYLDNVQLGDVSTTGHSSGAYGSSLNIAYNAHDSHYGNCEISEMIFYNKKLSTSEISALYTQLPPTLADVQIGSRYEETDTRNMYHKDFGGEYKVHSFLNSTDNFQITAGSGDVEYLVVAGGGGGYCGGGGAGGMRTGTLSVSAGNKTVTVGAGGYSGQCNVNGHGDNGVGANSVFDTITSTGGGFGGGTGGNNNTAGGSGGGAGGKGGSGTVVGGVSTASPNQGNDGGTVTTTDSKSGGGGGAGVKGDDPPDIDGGNGLQSSINGTATYYAGGGGAAGGINSAATGGNGGLGGGGTDGAAGTTNLGAGGGGHDASARAGYGGSGIVIVRYKTSSGITATGGTITTINGWSEIGA